MIMEGFAIDIIVTIKDGFIDLLQNPIIVVMTVLTTMVIVGFLLWDMRHSRKIKQLIHQVVEEQAFFCPAELKEVRLHLTEKRIPGVYLLHNKSKDLYFVGQGRKVLDKVASHFSGRGHKKVYADFKAGDEFAIKVLGLAKSGCRSLEQLEAEVLAEYGVSDRKYQSD